MFERLMMPEMKTGKSQEKGSEVFEIGKYNSSEAIMNLTEINGVSIEELEHSMRPGELSDAGFLGQSESLLEVMREDNEVLQEYGMTHQEVADLLEDIVRGMDDKAQWNDITVEIIQTKGVQFSPFKDNITGSKDIILTKNGKKLTFGQMQIEFIRRYGFYEGHGSQYRLEVRELMGFLGIHKKPKSEKSE